MLKRLEILNVALIDKLSIDFAPNLNVLSGETGAGKSIVIDALNFVIGGKASKSLIKQGREFMKVQALFAGDFSSAVKQILLDYDIELEDELLLTRKLSLDGKGDVKINGTSVTLAMLKNISSLLIDIHGQHEHQHLLKDKYHLQIIDGFIKDKVLFENYSAKLAELKQINASITKFNGSTQNVERMLDLLSYQINEIENAHIKKGEDEDLFQKKLVMQNSEKIFEGLENSIQNLDGHISVVAGVKDSSNSLKSISKYDDQIESLQSRLDGVKYELLDIVETLKQKKQECSFNQAEFDQIDGRLDTIKSLKKKYGPTLDDVFVFLEKSKLDYDNIANGKEILKVLLEKKNALLEEIYDLAKQLSEIRKGVSLNFEKRVATELSDLGMKNAKFKVDFKECPTFDQLEQRLGACGVDDIRFLFSANAGQSLKPLSEIISGGEASRFMLALKNILAANDEIASMVFDEIDTGISGDMGYKVACKMANISKNHQVLAVSHLPQICAMADNNIKVVKETKENETEVSICSLSGEDLLNEISRLSGGLRGNAASLEHAKELKSRCNAYKNTNK